MGLVRFCVKCRLLAHHSPLDWGVSLIGTGTLMKIPRQPLPVGIYATKHNKVYDMRDSNSDVFSNGTIRYSGIVMIRKD